MDVMENKAIRFRKKILPNPLKGQWRNYSQPTDIDRTGKPFGCNKYNFNHISERSAKIS